MIYLGIDPGQSGGLVSIKVDYQWSGPDEKAEGVITFTTMPKTEREVWDWFYRLKHPEYNQVVACIEKVSGYVGKPHPGSSMFNFGWGYGGLRMAMVGNDIEFDEIAPRTWMSAMAVQSRKRGESISQHKQKIKRMAESLYPRILTTLATSDAVLLATYCRRKHEGRWDRCL